MNMPENNKIIVCSRFLLCESSFVVRWQGRLSLLLVGDRNGIILSFMNEACVKVE